MANKFVMYHWLWQHMLQRQELGKMGELINAANLSSASHRQKIQRLWVYAHDYSIVVHCKVEDDLMFPGLRERFTTNEAALQLLNEVQAGHDAIEAQAAQTGSLVNDLAEQKEGVTKEAVVQAVNDYAAAYLRHIDHEEQIIPFVQQSIKEDQQLAIGKKIGEFMREQPTKYIV